MAVNLKQVLKHNWQVFPTKVRGVDFVGYRFFGEYTLLRKSTCKTFKRRMLSISSKRENNVSPTYSEWCSFNSYVGWLQHCDSFRLYQKYVEPNVEYMHNYYLKEVKVMQKFVNVRTTAESVKPLEIDDYHVYVNTGIKEIHEEAKEGDLSSGFDGFEIETQEIYEKDEYIQLMAEKNSSLEEQATDLQLALADVYEQMLGLSAN